MSLRNSNYGKQWQKSQVVAFYKLFVLTMVGNLYLHSLGDTFVLKESNMSLQYQKHYSKMESPRD